MNTLLLLCACNGTIWAGLIDKIHCTLIVITSIIALTVFLKAIIPPIIMNCHERKMAKERDQREVGFYEKEKERFEFQKSKLEFEQKLEIEKKIWDKLLKDTPDEGLEKKFNELKEQFEKLKNEYPKFRLDVDFKNNK